VTKILRNIRDRVSAGLEVGPGAEDKNMVKLLVKLRTLDAEL
jgi:hypothetical protein